MDFPEVVDEKKLLLSLPVIRAMVILPLIWLLFFSKVKKPSRITTSLQLSLSRNLQNFARVEVAGGFINFFLEDEILFPLFRSGGRREDFGAVNLGKGKKTQVEP